jgi:beta-lactam-binding protein with PASTA domain
MSRTTTLKQEGNLRHRSPKPTTPVHHTSSKDICRSVSPTIAKPKRILFHVDQPTMPEGTAPKTPSDLDDKKSCLKPSSSHSQPQIQIKTRVAPTPKNTTVNLDEKQAKFQMHYKMI